MPSIPDTIATLRATFNQHTTKPIAWRRHQIAALSQFLSDNQSAIENALQQDLGKSPAQSWLTEIGFLLKDIQYTQRHLARWIKPKKVPSPLVTWPSRSEIHPQPKGVVLIMGAWNYPVQLVLAPLIAAIAAGNCVVLKPSELAKHTEQLLLTRLPKYLDNNAIKVIIGDIETSQALLAHKFDHIFYTGGEKVGQYVMAQAAKHLTPITLELGGKSPCLVDQHCDLTVTAKRIVWSKWMNAGQTCIAPDYLLVHHSIAESLMTEIRKALHQFYGDNPEQHPDYGKIISNRHQQRLKHYLSELDHDSPFESNDEQGYLSPTLVFDPPLQSQLMQEEIFGPILPIVPYESIDDAIHFINERPHPLALYLFSRSHKVQQRVIEQTQSGSVGINDGMIFMLNPALPFGGIGPSGMGRYHGYFGFETFSHARSVLKRGFRFDVSLRYPPITQKKLDWLKKLF